MIKVIFACGENGEFGLNGGFPWGSPIKRDMQQFTEFTTGCVLLMGRKTFESLPCKFRGLTFIVMSTKYKEDIKAKDGSCPDIVVKSKDKDFVINLDNLISEDICVIGGADIIKNYIPFADSVSITEITRKDKKYFESDVMLDMDFIYKNITCNSRNTNKPIFTETDDYCVVIIEY